VRREAAEEWLCDVASPATGDIRGGSAVGNSPGPSSDFGLALAFLGAHKRAHETR